MLARHTCRRLVLISAIAATFCGAAVQAAPFNWTTGTSADTSGAWDGTASTFNGQGYTAADDLIIDGTAAKTITTTGTITTPLSLTISSTGATTLSGTSIGAAPLSLNGASGVTARIIAGTGTTLGTGAITVGTAVQSQAAYASGATPFLRVNGGGTQTVANNIALTNPGTLTHYALQSGGAAGSVLNLNGDISGGGANTILMLDTPNGGDSTTIFNLNGNNSLAGQIRLNRGRIVLGNANALGTSSLFIQTNGNATNGSLSFSGFTTLTNNLIIGTTAAQWINTDAQDITLSGVLSSATNAMGGFSKMGTGALILTGANTYNGVATAVADGTLSFTGSSRINSADYTGTLALTASTSILNYASSTSQGLTGVISGAGKITKSGTSVLTLSGVNTFGGGTTITTGTVAVGNNAGLGTGAVNANASFGAGYVSGGTPFLRTSVSGLTVNNNIILSSTAGYYGLQMGAAAGGSVTWGGIISGGGAGTVLQIDTPNSGDGTSVATLSGNNTIAGQIRLNRGRLVLANANALGTASLFMQTPGNATNGNLSFSGVTSLSNDLIIGATTNQWINTGAANVTLSGVVSSFTSGSGGLSKMGTGTLTLSGANTYNGSTTTVADGTLSITGSGRLNATAFTSPLILTATTSIFEYASSTNQTISGIVSGAGQVNKSGTSTLTLSVANTYTGNTTVNEGTLVVSATGSLANNGPEKIFVAAPDSIQNDSDPKLTRAVAGGTNYATAYLTGFGSTSISTAPLTTGTTAAILAGTSTAPANVSMQWRSRQAPGETDGSDPNTPLSDVVNLTGMPTGDVFLLQMSYKQTALGNLLLDEDAIAASGELRLGWFDTDTNTWETAVAENTGGMSKFVGIMSSADFLALPGTLASKLGSYGVDPSDPNGGVVWAVLNHNSEFAVIPEPSTLVFGGIALLGFAGIGLRRRRQRLGQ